MADRKLMEDILPQEPIDRLARPLQRFLRVEAASGIVLLLCAVAALVLANSPARAQYLAFWETHVALRIGSLNLDHSLQHWINDGLMAVFFFVIGLEVKRELVTGELRELRKAALPIAAALGGMVVPAAIYLVLEGGGSAKSGWGIPMATDIAFVVGCMAVLGKRVPHGLRIFLLSVAIADDIGAVVVIAVGYTATINLFALGLGAGGILLILGMQRIGIRSFGIYGIVGTAIWFAFYQSGVHATIAGVILGLLTPARSYISSSSVGRMVKRAGALMQGEQWERLPHRSDQVQTLTRAARETLSPLEYLEGRLHRWVGFMIMPVFALANAGVPFHLSDLSHPVALAVAAGLVIGKPVGIMLASLGAVKLGLARLPEGVGWNILAGAGVLSGIGFTMALFISGLALSGPMLDVAKVGILGGSSIAAAMGLGLLAAMLPKSAKEAEPR